MHKCHKPQASYVSQMKSKMIMMCSCLMRCSAYDLLRTGSEIDFTGGMAQGCRRPTQPG